jgi:hypothetical protein
MPTRFVPRRLPAVTVLGDVDSVGIGMRTAAGGGIGVGVGVAVAPGAGVAVPVPVGAGVVGDAVVGVALGALDTLWRARREGEVVVASPARSVGAGSVPSIEEPVVSASLAGDAPHAVAKESKESERVAVAQRVQRQGVYMVFPRGWMAVREALPTADRSAPAPRGRSRASW